MWINTMVCKNSYNWKINANKFCTIAASQNYWNVHTLLGNATRERMMSAGAAQSPSKITTADISWQCNEDMEWTETPYSKNSRKKKLAPPSRCYQSCYT